MESSRVSKLALLVLVLVIGSWTNADVGPHRRATNSKARVSSSTRTRSSGKTAVSSATVPLLSSRSRSNNLIHQPHDDDHDDDDIWSSTRPSGATIATAALLELRGGVVANKAVHTLPTAMAGTVAFAVIEKLVKMGLGRAKIKFPGQLGACILLFASLCLLDLASPSTAATVFDALSPGASLLAKWLPVFFVPGLALLPISKSIPGTGDVSHYQHLDGESAWIVWRHP